MSFFFKNKNSIPHCDPARFSYKLTECCFVLYGQTMDKNELDLVAIVADILARADRDYLGHVEEFHIETAREVIEAIKKDGRLS